MYQVQTDHQVVPFGDDQMALFDNNGGATIVTAQRTDGLWIIHADGVDDVTADTRPDAITAMIDQALTASPGDGYSTLVPHGLSDMP